MNEQLQRIDSGAIGAALTVSEILAQKALIQDAMKSAMQDGQHFGKIPGCGDKPTLLQPGAQTILLLFRMNPDYEVEIVTLDRGHREYRVKCRLTNTAGQFIGAGVGACSTMESKYRFRVAPKTITDREVPKAYWDLRKSEPAKAQELLGGKGFSTKKDEAGVWRIAEGSSDKIEHDNPADHYNTCLKMAKKRALVDATLTRTAASDIFSQDAESLKENMDAYDAAHATANIPQPTPKNAPQVTPEPAKGNSGDADTLRFEDAVPDDAPADPPNHINVKPGQPLPLEAFAYITRLIDFREAHNKEGAATKWTGWFCNFEDSEGRKLEAGTFSKRVAEALDVLKGEEVTIAYRPGKKQGSKELMSISPASDEGVTP